MTKKEEIERLRVQVKAMGNSVMSGDDVLALAEDLAPTVLGVITDDPDDAMIYVLKAALQKKR